MAVELESVVSNRSFSHISQSARESLNNFISRTFIGTWRGNRAFDRMPIKEIAIYTPGEFGTAMAQVLARSGHSVSLCCRTEEAYDYFIKEGASSRLLGVQLDERIKIKKREDLHQTIKKADLVILATSALHIEEVFADIKDDINPRAAVLSLIKGVVPETGERVSAFLFKQRLSLRRRTAVLSGPNFALDIANGLPAGTVIASENERLAKKIAKLFEGSNIRAYWTDDVIGVELGGILKNIIAYAAGIGWGMGFGRSGVSALITRALNEMTGLVVLAGGKERTPSLGLSGAGDLLGSLLPPFSRNFKAGELTGLYARGAEGGKNIQALRESGITYESLSSAGPIAQLIEQHDADYPILKLTGAIVEDGLSPEIATELLMARAQIPEEFEQVVDSKAWNFLNWATHRWSRKHRSPLQFFKDNWRRLTQSPIKDIVNP